VENKLGNLGIYNTLSLIQNYIQDLESCRNAKVTNTGGRYQSYNAMFIAVP
jgi:hypothetical protein